MRVADRPFPTVTAHAKPAAIPVRPVFAVEPKPVAYTWNDPLLTWDDPALGWDYVSSVAPWSDLFCDYTGVTLETGHPDDAGLVDTGHLIIQVDNTSGRWSQYNADGSLVAYGPGRHVAVWATDDVDRWWLFYGRVSRWDELVGDVVEIEAFDVQSDLAQPIGTFTPGVAADKPGQRAAAILAAANYADRRTLAAGIVTLTAQASTQTPLEELQDVAQSDGGVVWADADGTVFYAGRDWRSGRADQTTIPVVSDNVCTIPVIVWDPVKSTNDAHLADRVVLENLAGLRSTATALAPSGAYVLALSEQQWTTQAEGDTLAALLLAQQSPPRLRIDGFDLHLFDPRQPNVWRAVDWRLFDRLRYVTDTATLTGPARLDLLTLIVTIDHEITPEAWTMTVATTRAVDYARAILWDTPPYVWNDTSPAAVWAY